MISKPGCRKLIVGLFVVFLGQSCESIAPTVAASATQTAMATRSAIASPAVLSETAVVPTGTIDLSQMEVEEWASTSPDAAWVATGLTAFPKANASEPLAYVRLLIFRANGKALWKITDERQEIGLGFPQPAPLKWSNDGKHFYFSHRVVPDGCSIFETLSDLQRVNLQDGRVEELLPHAGLGLALSPDESKVAYLAYGNRGLVIRDLHTGAEKEFRIDPGEDLQGGDIVWSPDSESLAFTLAIHPCSGNYPSRTVWAESTSILLLQIETLEQKVLIQEDPRLFVTVKWNEPDRIVITDGAENSIWYLNARSGEVTRQ